MNTIHTTLTVLIEIIKIKFVFKAVDHATFFSKNEKLYILVIRYTDEQRREIILKCLFKIL